MNKRFVVMFGSKKKIYHEIVEDTNFAIHNYPGYFTQCNRIVNDKAPGWVDRFYSYRPKNHRKCKVCSKMNKERLNEKQRNEACSRC